MPTAADYKKKFELEKTEFEKLPDLEKPKKGKRIFEICK